MLMESLINVPAYEDNQTKIPNTKIHNKLQDLLCVF